VSDPRAQESGDVGYYEVFKNHTKISKVPTYTLSSSHQGATIRVSDGEEAVAFEVRETKQQPPAVFLQLFHLYSAI